MNFHVTYTTQQKSVKIRNEQLNEYNTHTYTHTQTHTPHVFIEEISNPFSPRAKCGKNISRLCSPPYSSQGRRSNVSDRGFSRKNNENLASTCWGLFLGLLARETFRFAVSGSNPCGLALLQ